MKKIKTLKLAFERETLARLDPVQGGRYNPPSVTVTEVCTYYNLGCRGDDVTRSCRNCTIA